jgi:transcriptional regulator with XRE-family HTH domain
MAQMRRHTMSMRAARDAKGLTQAELAELVGVDQTTISDLECRRNRNPSWRTVKRIADALGVAPETIFPVRDAAPQKGESA